jgi:hypothetical protein
LGISASRLVPRLEASVQTGLRVMPISTSRLVPRLEASVQTALNRVQF